MSGGWGMAGGMGGGVGGGWGCGVWGGVGVCAVHAARALLRVPRAR